MKNPIDFIERRKKVQTYRKVLEILMYMVFDFYRTMKSLISFKFLELPFFNKSLVVQIFTSVHVKLSNIY